MSVASGRQKETPVPASDMCSSKSQFRKEAPKGLLSGGTHERETLILQQLVSQPESLFLVVSFKLCFIDVSF